MAVQKIGETWRYRRRVRLPSGLRVRVGGSARRYNLANTKIGALEAEQRHIAEVTRPGPATGGVCGLTVRDLGEIAIESAATQNKPSTVDGKRDALRIHILPALGALDVSAVSFAVIEDFKSKLLAKGLVNKSVNNILQILGRMLTLARKRGLIAAKPELEMLDVPRADFDFLTFDETTRLIAAAEEGAWRTMVTVAARTGLRQGELLGLHWDDVDLKAGRIFVRHSYVYGRMGTPKSGKSREVPLSNQARVALTSERHLRGPLVFCSPAGSPLPFSQCRSPIQRACKRAGIREISWHVLRHTFASHLAMRGVALKAVQEMLGHESITVTMRYAHLAPHVARDAVLLLDAAAD